MNKMEGEAAATTGGKRSAWMSHVKKTMKANKGMKLMQVLKLAKKTYKKTGGALSPSPVESAPAATGGRRRTRKTKKSRKGGRKH